MDNEIIIDEIKTILSDLQLSVFEQLNIIIENQTPVEKEITPFYLVNENTFEIIADSKKTLHFDYLFIDNVDTIIKLNSETIMFFKSGEQIRNIDIELIENDTIAIISADETSEINIRAKYWYE